MAVTFATIKRNVFGNSRSVTADCTGPASYTTGGETLTAAQQNTLLSPLGGSQALNFGIISFFDSEQETTSGLTCALDRTNNKIMFWDGGTEVASTTNLSAVVVRCRFIYGNSATG